MNRSILATPIFCCLLFIVPATSISTGTTAVLKAWIEAHNSCDSGYFKEFIKRYYHSDLLSKIQINDHINFYNTVENDFGKVNPSIYKIVEESNDRLVIHLLKEGIPNYETECETRKRACGGD